MHRAFIKRQTIQNDETKHLHIFLMTAFAWLNTQNGILDPSFGTNGSVVIDVGSSDDISKSIAIQPDGKILLAGYASTSIFLVSYV